jgi:hypothetical protein
MAHVLLSCLVMIFWCEAFANQNDMVEDFQVHNHGVAIIPFESLPSFIAIHPHVVVVFKHATHELGNTISKVICPEIMVYLGAYANIISLLQIEHALADLFSPKPCIAIVDTISAHSTNVVKYFRLASVILLVFVLFSFTGGSLYAPLADMDVSFKFLGT